MKRIQIDLQLNQISKFIRTPSKHSKPTTEVITWSDLEATREDCFTYNKRFKSSIWVSLNVFSANKIEAMFPP